MNSKAFLFTISVIFFASTLVILTQLYSDYNLNNERAIISSYKITHQKFINDDLAFDLERILGQTIDFNLSTTDINFTIDGSISKPYNMSQKIVDYNSFLNNNYFSNISGTESLDFFVEDSTIEILFGTDYELRYNYDSNDFSFISFSDTLNTIDLNLDYTGSDLNQVIEPSSPSGSASINIFYTDDANSFSASYSFSPTTQYEVKFVYGSDYNIAIIFGDTGNNNSLKIDSNSPNELNYSIKLNYSFDSNVLPIYYNSILRYSTDDVDSNSFLKKAN